MKLGILTYHRSYNYGAFMQCYTLSKRIKSDFPELEVEVIDYNMQSSYNGYQTKLDMANEYKRKMLEKQYKIFDDAQKEFLPLSKKQMRSDDCDEFLKNIKDEYDIIVVGSDAVWNWNGKKFPNAYFLPGNVGAAKMSYAASAHGFGYSSVDKSDMDAVKKYIDDFYYVGVRENTTRQMLEYAGCTAEVNRNCDPTVLLDVDKLPINIDNLKQKLIAKGIDFNKPIIGMMANEPYGKMIKKYFGNRIQLVAVYEPNKYADFFLDDLNPLEWARVFSLFNVTLTHFFHGTMLSLRNLTPVMAVEVKSAYNSKYVTKINNLLTNLDLKDCYAVLEQSNSAINRIMYKLGINNDKKFWNEICKRIEELIANPPKEKIFKALESEAEYYNSFRDALAKLIDEENKNG